MAGVQELIRRTLAAFHREHAGGRVRSRVLNAKVPGEAALVQQKVSFPSGGPEQTPGVVVMRIDDSVGTDVDRNLRGLVVVFNASDEATSQTVAATAGSTFALHPVQAGGIDSVVKTATHDAASGTFTVPARTVAVFQAK